MVFVLIGVLLLVLKLLEVGAVATWAWWWVLSPFGVALAWWAWSDASGLTRKREMMRDEERKEARRKRNVENMGMSPTQRRR
ncbi:MAG: hypothetical protein CFE46_07745 [Burkholderiales bacterium PBB6]|uniref:TIGR04438 family Trp-rich protein n=1 Tax=Ideonella margarita TaxID=2984191 RepID=A0ABU9C2H5_9BURK|nr:MAG: hypothetical protein CFE46_07745 [Burkholderiales bacterium PBB6]